MASSVENLIRNHCLPLYPNNKKEVYSKILQEIGPARVVMIGEASHGTHEFYEQRAELTKLLIEEKGFNIVCVEADWPDAYRANRFVQAGKNSRDRTPEESLRDFERFPKWMWRNRVVEQFLGWLRNRNDNHPHQKAAIYGMDLYSMFRSMDEVIEYLKKVSPEDAKKAVKAYSNFERFQGEPGAYGFAAGIGLSSSYEKQVVQILTDLQKKGEEYLRGTGGLIDGDELFYVQENAALVKDAEEYYRKMYHADERTWNIRDFHMANTIQSILRFHDKKFTDRTAKTVIWAHNSHLGDARQTDAGRLRGEWNVGQILRERLGMDLTYNIGFSTYTGTVTAARSWDQPSEKKKVSPGLPGSYETLFHEVVQGQPFRDFALIFRSNVSLLEDQMEMIKELSKKRLERYIGVIYRPDTERQSHYSNSHISKEFDALLYFDTTNAVEPLDREAL